MTLHDCLKSKIGNPEKAFSIFDANNEGTILVSEFEKVLQTFGKDRLTEGDVHTLTMIAHGKNPSKVIKYKEFCSKFDSWKIWQFRQDLNVQDTTADSKIFKQASINYIIRKSFELNINLRTVFRRNDENEIQVIPRLWFKRILEGLPLGLSKSEITDVMDNDIVFDRYGNVDYMAILNTDLYSWLEMQDIEKKKQERI